MIYLLLIVNLVCFVYLVLRSFKDFEKINYFIFFAFFNLLYTSAIPVEIILFKKPQIFEDNIVSENTISLLLFLSTISNIAFYIGLFLTTRKKDKNIQTTKPHTPFFLFYLFLILLGLMVFFFRNEMISSIKSYQGNAVTTYNSSTYAYLKEIFFSLLAILSLVFLKRSKKFWLISFLITFFLAGISLLSSDKDPLLLASIPWIWLFFNKLHPFFTKRSWIVIVGILIIATLIPLLTTVFGIYRNNNENNYNEALDKYGLYGQFESRNVLMTFADATSLERRLYGKTYLLGFVNWIPKSIWNERPSTLAEIYAKYKVKKWTPGKGVGFSLLAESYLNFGTVGAFIQYLMIGLIFGFQKKLTDLLFSENLEIAKTLFFIWAFYELVMMHRGQFNMPSSYIRFMLPVFAFYLSFDRIIPMIITKIRK